MAFLPGLKKQINKVSTWAAAGKMDLNIFLPGKSVYERENQWSGRNKARRWFPQVRRRKKPLICCQVDHHNLNIAAWKRRRICSTSWSMTCRSKQKSTFRWWQHENLLLCCVCYFYWLDHFQPNPTVRAKMAAVKVVFLFKLNLLPFYIYKKNIWLIFPPSTVHSK